MVRVRKEKVVSAREMARIEKKSFEDGQSPERYMNKAGKGIAERVQISIEEHENKRQVSLLVGKGNNGGDAFAAGICLLELGYEVNAFHLFAFEESSQLCQEKYRHFREEGGEVYHPKSLDELAFYQKGVILDGLLGTGFDGSTSGFLAEVIEFVNAQDIPVLSIDIPSGVNGNTGEVKGEAIIANETLYLGLPKIGLFVGDGYAYSGELHPIDFGMPPNYIDDASALCYTFQTEAAKQLMPVPHPQQHKYNAGYVVTLSGSQGMSGAAFLSTFASLRSGAGIVHLFYNESMRSELGGKPWEVIAEPFNAARVEKELQRAGALVVGPGLSLSHEVTEILTKTTVPTVVDASAIKYIPSIINACKQDLLLTPHRGELSFLIDLHGASDMELVERCQAYVDETGAYLLVKGAPTFFFERGEEPIVLPVGNPGMATAGTGDVLSGILGALIAQGLLAKEAGPVGAYLHGLAGDIVAAEKGELSLIAGDLIDALPSVFSMHS